MLKDRDYDVTPHIIAHMYLQMRGGSVKDCEVDMGDGRRRVRGVLWRWSAKSGRSVGRGEVKGLVVVSSVTWSVQWWHLVVIFISPVGVARQGERHG